MDVSRGVCDVGNLWKTAGGDAEVTEICGHAEGCHLDEAVEEGG